MSTFRNYADYEIPLLQVLSDLPNGQGATKEVKDHFGERFNDRIPDEQRVYLESVGEVKWRNMVAWARSALTKRELIDSPAYGIWRITDAGRTYLAPAISPSPPVGLPSTDQPSLTPEHIKASVRKSEYTRVEAHADLLKRVHAIVDSQIAVIHDFLNGRVGRPSDERLCDWVHTCYEFELYREGRELFALVDPVQVNPWYYERAKRLAKVCAMKVAGHA
jgi:hypothetical protein